MSILKINNNDNNLSPFFTLFIFFEGIPDPPDGIEVSKSKLVICQLSAI